MGLGAVLFAVHIWNRPHSLNAAMNGIDNAEFIVGQGQKVMPCLYKEGLRPDVIVVDPPRAGCAEPLLEAIVNMQPRRFVYVSCNPTTLARDLAFLGQKGFGVQEVQPVDMFPHTGHVEWTVRLNFESPNKTSHRELIGYYYCSIAAINGSEGSHAMEEYHDLLERFVQQNITLLGDNLTGVYLHGSAVMGCFNPRKSDKRMAGLIPSQKFQKYLKGREFEGDR